MMVDHPIRTLLLSFFLLCALGAVLEAVRPPKATAIAFDVHDPLTFQDHCGEASWRKATYRSDGMPESLTIYYPTQGFGIGQMGVMVQFFHGKKDDPLRIDYSDLTFISVPSTKPIEQRMALEMLGCLSR
ncbi:MAG: hypothetical protein RB191_03255 [Terriglobia bacterium]|nr:hypothetical protein [Terriglobia bacterium]